MAVLGDDSSLIWLSNVSEDNVDHTDQESVVLGFSGIVDDWDDVGSLFSHVDQISSDSVGEFDSVHNTFRANDIRDVRNGGSRGGTEIKNFGSWIDSGFGNTTNN